MNYSIHEMRTFAAVAETGNQSAAAKRCGLTPAAISAIVKRLELALGVRLFERTSRSTTLTPEGEAFLASALRALEILDQTQADLLGARKAVSGVIRVAVPSDLVRTALGRHLQAFQQQHPDIVLSLHLSDAVHNLQADAMDLAVRYGELPNSGLVARKLRNTRRITCAAPAYLAAHGTPRTPQELAQHECLAFWVGGRMEASWRFWVKGAWLRVPVRGHWCSDDSALVRQWAIDGRGLVNKSDIDLADDIQAGRLVPVLTKYKGPDIPLSLVLGTAKPLPQRTRALADFLVERFASAA